MKHSPIHWGTTAASVRKSNGLDQDRHHANLCMINTLLRRYFFLAEMAVFILKSRTAQPYLYIPSHLPFLRLILPAQLQRYCFLESTIFACCSWTFGMAWTLTNEEMNTVCPFLLAEKFVNEPPVKAGTYKKEDYFQALPLIIPNHPITILKHLIFLLFVKKLGVHKTILKRHESCFHPHRQLERNDSDQAHYSHRELHCS